jgi:hypothetical protein
MGVIEMVKRGRVRRGPDRGTDQAQAKRAALVGPTGDPVRAEYPLGVLLERGIIDEEMHTAGLRYAGRARAMLPRVNLRQASTPRLMTNEAEATKESKWRHSCEALLDIGRAAKDAVDNLCVYERAPRWLLAQVNGWEPRKSDERERLALTLGLDALAKMEFGQREVA